MDLSTLIVPITVIVGLVNGVRLLNAPQATAFVLFILAVVLGLVFGLLHLFGLNVETGIIAGLASSGLYRLGQVVGGR